MAVYLYKVFAYINATAGFRNSTPSKDLEKEE